MRQTEAKHIDSTKITKEDPAVQVSSGPAFMHTVLCFINQGVPLLHPGDRGTRFHPTGGRGVCLEAKTSCDLL